MRWLNCGNLGKQLCKPCTAASLFGGVINSVEVSDSGGHNAQNSDTLVAHIGHDSWGSKFALRGAGSGSPTTFATPMYPRRRPVGRAECVDINPAEKHKEINKAQGAELSLNLDNRQFRRSGVANVGSCRSYHERTVDVAGGTLDVSGVGGSLEAALLSATRPPVPCSVGGVGVSKPTDPQSDALGVRLRQK